MDDGAVRKRPSLVVLCTSRQLDASFQPCLQKRLIEALRCVREVCRGSASLADTRHASSGSKKLIKEVRQLFFRPGVYLKPGLALSTRALYLADCLLRVLEGTSDGLVPRAGPDSPALQAVMLP